MKKFLFFLVLTFFCFVLFSQNDNLETITKIRTEQEIAERLEKLLEPIAGKIIVSVDLTLQYPKLDLSTQKTAAEKTERLSISRKKAAIASLKRRKEQFTTFETKILAKKITVYLPKNTDFEVENLVRSSIKEWLNIAVGKGDRIYIKKILPAATKFTKAEKPQKKIISEPATAQEVQTVTSFF